MTASPPERGTRSPSQLIVRRFARHRAAVAALGVLAVLYGVAAFAEFFAPYHADARHETHLYAPPQPVRWTWKDGLHAESFALQIDPVTLTKDYVRHPDRVVPLGFFVRGSPYRLWGLVPLERRFFGADLAAWEALPESGRPASPVFFLLGGDRFGRDVLSRLVFGARISLSIGLVAIVITFVLGVTIGGVSGYLGGRVDMFCQRGIEIINAFPQIPLWLAMGAVLPSSWTALKTYFAITLVFSLLNWTGLARVVRGMILSLREQDYITAARLLGASPTRILFVHLIPGVTSHIIVALTLAVPAMILGETALSFLGLGLRPPVVSWGVLMQDCLDLQVLDNHPWLLMPVFATIVSVLCFNFLGDGLRDAADPYSGR